MAAAKPSSLGNLRVASRGVARTLLLACAVLMLSLGRVAAQVDFPVIQRVVTVTGAVSPTCIAHAGDGSGRLFVVEKQGRIRIVQGGAFLATPFLDISSEVYNSPEEVEPGLLGMAFPPNFATNPHFYVDYTRASDAAVVISRFALTANGNVADPASEQIILVISKPYHNHNGGQIAFGPDGYLYIGVGDGGSEDDPNNEGQTTSTLLGKLLRIDVESGVSPYAIPPTNPFVGNSAFSPEIWAYGLRNPWRFSFDRQTGDLYIGDVGQDTWEEVDFQAAASAGGQNYGWRVREGAAPFNVPAGFNLSTLTDPVFSYAHNTAGGDCIIGGYVYRGPSSGRMNGMYIFGDYTTGSIWGLKSDGVTWHGQKLTTLNSTTFSTFGEDDAGNLYVADVGRGVIYQLTDSLAANAPSFTPLAGTYNTPITTQVISDSNSTIYYTTDGSTPTTSSPSVASGATFNLTQSTFFKAFAAKPGLSNSLVSTNGFTLQTARPQFSLAAGYLTGPTMLSITSATPGATIYYTTDGSTPTTASQVYTGPITVNAPETVQALAVYGAFVTSTTSAYYPLTFPEDTLVSKIAGNGLFGNDDGPALQATFEGPLSLCIDSAGNIYMTDFNNNTVRKLTPAGQVSTIAGSAISGLKDGLGSAAQFNHPGNIGIDASGNLLVMDMNNSVMRKVTPAGQVTTVTTSNPYYFYAPGQGMCFNPSGTVYYGNYGMLIKLVGNTFSTVVGPGPNGTNPWQSYVSAAMGPSGQIYISNTAGTISAVSATGVVTPFAGNASKTGYTDGSATAAQFSSASAICADVRGNLYVCDAQRIRKVRPNGAVSTLAGNGTGGEVNGPGNAAEFLGPRSICADAKGNIYVAESNVIRKITQSHWDAGINSDSIGDMLVSWPTTAGTRYQPQFSTDLTHWQNFGPVLVGDGTIFTAPDNTAPAASGKRFYHVLIGVP